MRRIQAAPIKVYDSVADPGSLGALCAGPLTIRLQKRVAKCSVPVSSLIIAADLVFRPSMSQHCKAVLPTINETQHVFPRVTAEGFGPLRKSAVMFC